MVKLIEIIHRLHSSLGLLYDLRINSSECSAAWLAQLLWEQWVGGSNPSTPISLIPKSSILLPDLSRARLKPVRCYDGST